MSDELHATELSHAYPTARRGVFSRAVAVPALHEVTFSVGRGETVGLVGRSGSGKSTLLRALLALERPMAGTVHLGERRVRPAGARSLRWFRRRVQYVPQDPGASLDPRMTVRELVGEPLKRLGVGGDHRTRVAAALDDVGLPSALAARRPAELSGGQAQRAAIARAIVTEPEFLLADEPVSGLDLPMRDRVLELLASLSAMRTLGLVFVSHDLEAVARLCERTVILAAGRVVEEGPTERLLSRPRHPATLELVESIPRLPPLGGLTPLGAYR